MMACSFVETLLMISEKAANVAKVCRSDEHLFELLIQQKSEGEANQRFIQDFKTLADVLIQETLKHDIVQKFPNLSESIHGEENNEFKNALEKTIRVEVMDDCTETATLLAGVLDGDHHAADLLASEVHRQIVMDDLNCVKEYLPNDELFDFEDIAIWIDPIDSTAEYINGSWSVQSPNSMISTSGLANVTILIGVFTKSTGVPILGVVNQPFSSNDNASWTSQIYWGYCHPENKSLNQSSISQSETNSSNSIQPQMKDSSNLTVVLSSVEDQSVREAVKSCNNQSKLIDVAGAGYKILTVCLGLSDAFILSRGNTYKWDTCALHAILKSLGGNIVNYDEFSKEGKLIEVRYDVEYNAKVDSSYNAKNGAGIIAYRDTAVLDQLKRAFLGT